MWGRAKRVPTFSKLKIWPVFVIHSECKNMPNIRPDISPQLVNFRKFYT